MFSTWDGQAVIWCEWLKTCGEWLEIQGTCGAAWPLIYSAAELCSLKRVIDCYDSTSAGRSLCAEDVCEISRLHRHRHPRARRWCWRQHCRFQHRQRTHAAATVGTRGRAGRCLQPRPHQAGRVSRVLVSELHRCSRWQRSLRRRPRVARAHLHDGGNAGRRRNAANAGGPDFLELLRHAGRHARRRAHVYCAGGTPRRRDSRRHRHLRALAARTARSSLHRQDDQGQFPDFTVVGIAPQGFTGTMALLSADVYLPLGVFDTIITDPERSNSKQLADRSNNSLILAGRLKPGLSRRRAHNSTRRLVPPARG